MNNDIAAGFAATLKKMRKKRRVAALTAALSVGVAVNTYRHWEAGTRLPRADDLLYLAAFFGVTPSDFFVFALPNAGLALQETTLRCRLMAQDTYEKEAS